MDELNQAKKLAKKYHSKDLVTHGVFEDLLTAQVSDEEDWEKLSTRFETEIEIEYRMAVGLRVPLAAAAATILFRSS